MLQIAANEAEVTLIRTYDAGVNEVKKLATQLCAAAMAFLAFTTSMIIGLWVNNPFVTVIGRSIMVMFIFYALGAILSLIGQKVIRENFDAQAEILLDNAQQKNEETVDESQENLEKMHSETPVPEPEPANG